MERASDASIWGPMRDFLARTAELLPVLLAVLLTLVAGLAAAFVLGSLVKLLLRLLRFDRVARRPQVADRLLRAGVRHTPSALAERVVRWVVVLAALLAALSILSVEVTDQVMTALVHYLPRLAAGLFILVVGYAASVFIGRSVLLWAVNARLQGGRWVARASQILVGVFFAALALENLGFGRDIAVMVLAILLGGIVLAGALAFGLAGRDLARQSLERMTRDMQEDDRDTISHL